MKVVHVGKYYPPEYRGGLESVVVGINDEMVRRGVSVAAVVAAVSGFTRSDSWRGVDVRRVRNLANVFSQPVTPSFASEIRTTPGDLLHLHHPNPIGDLAVLGDPRPLVITQHSDIVRQALLRPFYLPLLRRAFAKARAITVGSHGLLGASRELKGFESKTRVIPFGIDPARFALTDTARARAAELRAQWGEKPVVLAVGRLVSYKGFDVLISAMRGLDATLVIVGTGPEESRLRSSVIGHRSSVFGHRSSVIGHRSSVFFAGRISDDDLLAHYHACDLFCLPSVTIAEAFGMVLLEAMACGKPLITTRLPTGVSEVNRAGLTGLQVEPGNAGELREAIRAMLEDESRRRAMGQAARDVQAREYSAALMGQRFLDLYREVSGVR